MFQYSPRGTSNCRRTEPSVYYTFSYTHVPRIKFNLQIRYNKILTAITKDEIENYKTSQKKLLNVVFLSSQIYCYMVLSLLRCVAAETVESNAPVTGNSGWLRAVFASVPLLQLAGQLGFAYLHCVCTCTCAPVFPLGSSLWSFVTGNAVIVSSQAVTCTFRWAEVPLPSPFHVSFWDLV